MSGGIPNAPSRSGSIVNGPPSASAVNVPGAGYSGIHHAPPTPVTSTAAQNQTQSQQNLNQIEMELSDDLPKLATGQNVIHHLTPPSRKTQFGDSPITASISSRPALNTRLYPSPYGNQPVQQCRSTGELSREHHSPSIFPQSLYNRPNLNLNGMEDLHQASPRTPDSRAASEYNALSARIFVPSPLGHNDGPHNTARLQQVQSPLRYSQNQLSPSPASSFRYSLMPNSPVPLTGKPGNPPVAQAQYQMSMLQHHSGARARVSHENYQNASLGFAGQNQKYFMPSPHWQSNVQFARQASFNSYNAANQIRPHLPDQKLHRAQLLTTPSASSRPPQLPSSVGNRNSISRDSKAPHPKSQLVPNRPTEVTQDIVLEYLAKKGYSRTEAILRKEAAQVDSSSLKRAEDFGGKKYDKAYTLLQSWVNDSLETYRPELIRLLWPIFVHCVLDLAADCYTKDLEVFFKRHSPRFAREHEDELRQLQVITLPEHLDASIAKTFRSNKYRLTISSMAYNVLLQYLESKETEGGSVIITILQNHLNIVTVDRARIGPELSLASMLARHGEEFEYPAEDEGIPGHHPGSANTEATQTVLPKLALGQVPMDTEMSEDVEAGLEDEDAKNPPRPGEDSLLEIFQQKMKREPIDDAPSRDAVPLPPPMARDVAMEIQKIREHRDRFKIDPRTGGVPPGVSICMYTFHNTYDSINCLDFSGDLLLVAAGTKMSYIQVWSLDGSPLVDVTDEEEKPSNSRRLIGHSGPVMGISFSPSTTKPSSDSPDTKSRLLLSASADGTIRMWSLDAFACLVVFKSHDAPVWDIKWSPHGLYFLTCGSDKVARVWSQEHIAPLRMFVGHENDVDCGAFHPNGAYVFTAGDKAVRMWDIMKGTCVRMFTGHTGNITAIECAPHGKTLATADDQGAILLWDLITGKLVKRMRGHGKGGIWSLSWSVESTVIVSGGADMTVRVWDVDHKPFDKSTADGGIAKIDGGVLPTPGISSSTVTTQKKSKKDVVVTPDQLSVFPTKRSPVYKVAFTRSNLVVAGSAYMPEPATTN